MDQRVDDLEALGAFYIGRRVEPATGERTAEPILYTAKDLTTHGLCVGMTGSGKTGLSVALLEEAAIDGIPAIVIDPKGDLANLLLTFPELTGERFEPWIDPAEAARNERSVAEEAAAVASRWADGLAEWGQGGERIARFEAAAERVLYTPGSEAGRPLSILGSFAAPTEAVRRDPDALREEAVASASALCALTDLDADPVTSREHILLSTLFTQAWGQGQALDLASLVRGVFDPPFEQVGALTLEDFFPAAERKKLGMRLNNLLASPGFAAWMAGEPLDVERLLYAPDGRPRVSILSIAHLSDRERMFFVTVLLTRVLSWIRGQPGTSSLRAILFMDEVFGFFPPVAEPPSKRPMLTLLKQARAYGLGVLLSTQNPVDLDYKGLSNCGTWFLGRLSTERDVARVLEGLAGAARASGGAFDEDETRTLLSGLGSRRFMMRNVHEDAPVLFETRWVLSYLRGPLTREQIGTLVERPASDDAGPADAPAAEATRATASTRPILDPDIRQRFVTPTGGEGALEWRPYALATAAVHHKQRGSTLDHFSTVGRIATLRATAAGTWDGAVALDARTLTLTDDEPEAGGRFVATPRFLTEKGGRRELEKELERHLYEKATAEIHRCEKERAWSEPGEGLAAFTARMELIARERRDGDMEALEKKYAPRIGRVEEKIRRARERVEREKDQKKARQVDTAVSVGSTVLGALFGRRVLGRATTAARGVNRAAREAADVRRAEAKLSVLESDLADLTIEADEELTRQRARPVMAPPIETRQVRPIKRDIDVTELSLLWVPYRMDADGAARKAY